MKLFKVIRPLFKKKQEQDDKLGSGTYYCKMTFYNGKGEEVTFQKDELK